MKRSSIVDKPIPRIPVNEDYAPFLEIREQLLEKAFAETNGVNDNMLADTFLLELEVIYDRLRCRGVAVEKILPALFRLADAFRSGVGERPFRIVMSRDPKLLDVAPPVLVPPGRDKATQAEFVVGQQVYYSGQHELYRGVVTHASLSHYSIKTTAGYRFVKVPAGLLSPAELVNPTEYQLRIPKEEQSTVQENFQLSSNEDPPFTGVSVPHVWRATPVVEEKQHEFEVHVELRLLQDGPALVGVTRTSDGPHASARYREVPCRIELPHADPPVVIDVAYEK